MENRIGNSSGEEIPKKSRSLDLKSLYKSKSTKESPKKSLKRKDRSVAGDGNKKKKIKKSRKAVSLSSLENVDSNSRKSLEGVPNGGLSAHDLPETKLGLGQKLSNGNGFNGISLCLDDGVVQIPKRKRGFVGRNKFESSQASKPAEQSTSKTSPVNPITKITNEDSGSQAEPSKVTLKKGLDELKENRNKVSNSAQNKEECRQAGYSAVNNGESSLNKSRSSHRKRKALALGSKNHARDAEASVDTSSKRGDDFPEDDEENLKENAVDNGESSLKKSRSSHRKGRALALGSKTVAQDAEASVDASSKRCDDLPEDDEENLAENAVNNGESTWKKSRHSHRKGKALAQGSKSLARDVEASVDTSRKKGDDLPEDDEENLEENAARMLSSRFDPSCTGFVSNSKVSAPPSINGLSFLLSSDRKFVSRGSKSFSTSGSVLHDAAGRVLRPRKNDKEKGNARKRRHFYEIFSEDFDADWVLNRRIKVFWPLDQSWYYGLVNDYDKERKLHHVKYDDRDEEWINLQNERFKLLLFPSEIPGKGQRKRSRARDKHSHKGKGKPNKGKEKRSLIVDDDSCMGSYMDSEPIISWLARSTHRVKSSPFRSIKKQKTSSEPLVDALPLLSSETVSADGCVTGQFLKRDKLKLHVNSTSLEKLADVRRSKESESKGSTCSENNKLPIVYFRRRFRRTGKASLHTAEGNNSGGCASEPATSFVPVVDRLSNLGDYDAVGSLDRQAALWVKDNLGLLKLSIPLIESKQLRFDLSFSAVPVLNFLFGAENLWLFHAVLLLQFGTVVNMWPRVHLEMLFVDNVVGLRFLFFEGCLKQAIALVFQVLTVFSQPTDQGKYANLQLPVTSIRFKLSCIQNLMKQLVFVFYNFVGVKNSKWLYLDYILKRHCLLTRHLPLSECTYDNIKALQNGTNQLVSSVTFGDSSSSEGLQRRSRQHGSLMSRCKESSYTNISLFDSDSDKKRSCVPPFALSFAAAPTLFLSLHLKLLMEHRLTHMNFSDHCSLEHIENSGGLMVDDCSSIEDCSNRCPESTLENNLKELSEDATCRAYLSSAKSVLKTGDFSGFSGRHWDMSSGKCQNDAMDIAGTSASSHGLEEIGSDSIVALQKWQCQQPESEQCVSSSSPSVDRDKAGVERHSLFNNIRVEIPFNQTEKDVDRELHGRQQSADLTWNVNGGIIPSPNPTAPRSTWHRNRSSSLSLGCLSHGWSEGKADFLHNNFGSGPKKPRTQVSYSLPFGGFDYGSRNKAHHQKGVPHKRIRRASDKRSTDVSRGSQKNLELLSCDANVLVTLGDRGWRECGARIVLELFDHNEWKLAVKISGATRYSYKAHQFLQPGSTNRFTHAMMWKGGKDWTLEFPDRSQWALFKEMHEECHNQNIRAASVKNIPIPGVCLIEENDDNGTEVAFIRSSSKYFRQLESDAEMALDPSRVLYDMDSDDEKWILRTRQCSEGDNGSSWDISEEMFEKAMDMFEKAAYVHKRDHLTSDEIEDFMAGVGPVAIIRRIYEHWRLKRQRNRMPLIRHLQPPLWEKYQQQVREWELAMTKINTALTGVCQKKAAAVEKPAMFAFCLKPRGLEVPNRGSKQRSQKKISVSGQNIITASGDHDGLHNFGRRSNGFASSDEKFLGPGHIYESLEESPLPQTSPRVFLPRDSGITGYFSVNGDGYDGSYQQKLQRSKSRKFGAFASSSYNQRLMGRRNGIHRWNTGYSDWPSSRLYYSDGPQRYNQENLNGPDLDEFRLRDASGAAQHALNMAKLKREKAQRLLYRADLAIHKAVVALMTAEAIQASSEDFGDG